MRTACWVTIGLCLFVVYTMSVLSDTGLPLRACIWGLSVTTMVFLFWLVSLCDLLKDQVASPEKRLAQLEKEKK